jgi:hypothetical protein
MVTVLGTGILKESASCNYYSFHYNILPRVMDNIYIQYEPSVIVVSIVDCLIWKEEFDTLNGTNIPVKFSESVMDFNEFQLKGFTKETESLKQLMFGYKYPLVIDNLINVYYTSYHLCYRSM